MSTAPSGKKPNVYYAQADGVDLPLVDVTNPEFALSIGPAEQRAALERYMRAQKPFNYLPRWLRRQMFRQAAKHSLLARGMSSATEKGTYLSGLNTYLFKLGPNNLSTVTTDPLDRRIAESPAGLSIRLRLQDVAQLLAEHLAPALAGEAGKPLHLLNIAGGPAMDSINALILLNRSDPQVLKARAVVIHVLDLDTAGPAFGARALAALSVPGAPLNGLQIDFRHRRYDWTRADDLAPVIEELRVANALWAVSSEGGLFDYGSDADVLANLEMLTGAQVVAGSVTRADGLMQAWQRDSTVPLVMRGHAAFATLAARAGWKVSRVIERIVSDQVALVR
jgi:hypothetical protein